MAGDEFRHERLRVTADIERGEVTFEVSSADPNTLLTQELTKAQLSVLLRYLTGVHTYMR
jgi:hypothetical protein